MTNQMKFRTQLSHQERNESSIGKGGFSDYVKPDSEFRGISRIPNIASFRLGPAILDSRFLNLGIQRNLPRDVEFELLDENDKLNKYIKYQIKRLIKIRDCDRPDRAKLFFSIVRHLVLHSHAFYMSSLHHTLPDWYCNYSGREVLSLRKRFLRCALKSKFRLKRVYILKGDGSNRPLGVPTIPTRMVCYLYSKFLMIGFENIIPEFQHGYQSGKGVVTAGDYVLKFVIKSPYIFEFDLKNFFGSLNPDKLITELMTAEVFEDPKFFDVIFNYMSTPVWVNPVIEDKGLERNLRKLRRPDGNDIILPDDYYELGKAKSQRRKIEGNKYYLGVPQGGNLSPLLAILGLTTLYRLVKECGADIIMYADDGLIYSNKPFNPTKIFGNRELIEDGVVLRSTKSSGVRFDGQWVKDLLFLGLKYLPTTDNLMSWTRKGIRMVFDKGEIFAACKAGLDSHEFSKSSPTKKDLGKELQSKYKTKFDKGHLYVVSGLQGFIYSRLVQGKGNPSFLTKRDGSSVDRSLKWKKGSWLHLAVRSGLKLDITNASSFGFRELSDRLRGAPVRESKVTLKTLKLSLVIEPELELMENIGGRHVYEETEASNIGVESDYIKNMSEEEKLSLVVSKYEMSGLPKIRKYYIGHLKRNWELLNETIPESELLNEAIERYKQKVNDEFMCCQDRVPLFYGPYQFELNNQCLKQLPPKSK